MAKTPRQPTNRKVSSGDVGNRKPSKSFLKISTKRILKIALFGVLGSIVALFLLFGAVYIGLFGPLPSEADLMGIKNSNASEIYSSDKVLMGKYFVENRSSMDFDDIPKLAIDALVATEDQRFFEHEGIDFYSIPRVVVKTIIFRDRSGGGGSTISQQLIKNVFERKRYGPLTVLVNKLRENIAALKLEELYSKEEIVTLYLNTVSFGENVFGLKAASQRFFGKEPKNLKPEEVAMLIGMLKANTSYNPRLHPEAAVARRNTVLILMERDGVIGPEQLRLLIDKPLVINYQKAKGQEGSAAYLQATLEQQIKDLIKDQKKPDGSPYDLYTDGLRIELTVNHALQAKAERALNNHMNKVQKDFDKHWADRKPWGKSDDFLWKEAKKTAKYQRMEKAGAGEKAIKDYFNLPKKTILFGPEGSVVKDISPLDSIAYHQLILQAAFLAIDAQSGAVLAYVGGRDFSFFPYDHVYSRRQCGSTFKPFVYAAALEAGFSPCDWVQNEPISFPDYENWQPANSNGQYGGYYSIKGGLTYSVNTVAARLINETGTQAVVDVAKRAGLRARIPNLPSIALGVADASLAEMVAAYTMISQQGRRPELIFIKQISDSEGKVLYASKAGKSRSALEPAIAEDLRTMMQLVVDSGTARSLRSTYGLRMDLAGKTGTTQNNADGWFVATTPRVAVGAWVGGESPIVRFRSTALGQGASTALPIVGTWLRAVSSDGATAGLLGRNFTDLDPYAEPRADCPLFTEQVGSGFIDDLFGNPKKIIGEKAPEDTSGGSWINSLLERLEKDKDE